MNYHKIAEELADAGIHFHIGGKPGYNDIASIVSDEGETIYGILSSALTSFRNIQNYRAYKGRGTNPLSLRGAC